MSTAKTIIFAAVAIALSAGLGIFTYKISSTPTNIHSQLKHATYLYDQQVSISNFNLIDHNNKAFTKDNIRDQWTFWFFGFTHCPDICPITLGTLSAAVNTLQEKHKLNDKISIVFVSVDPERDNVAKLKSYVAAFSENAIGVTAPLPKLSSFLKNMGVIAKKQTPQKSESDYLVDHSSSVYLIAPDTGISAVFGTPHNVNDIVHDFLTIRKNFK